MNIIRKLVPSVLLIKKWQIKLGDAGTIDRFLLALQYHNFFFFKEWTKTTTN